MVDLRRHLEGPDLGPTSPDLFPLLQFRFHPKTQSLGKAASFHFLKQQKQQCVSVATSRVTSKIKLKVT